MKTIEKTVPATLAFARGLFTRGTDAFGAEEIKQAFGIEIVNLPPIPFSEAELTQACKLGQYLIFQTGLAKDGKPLTMKKIHHQFGNELGGGKLLYKVDWYGGEAFFTTDTPTLGWKLTSREVISGSTGEDYVSQTGIIADYLANEVYKGEELPDEYRSAVGEWNARRAELEELRSSDWKKCAEECASLRLNQLFREKPVEVLYGLVVQHEVNHERLLENTYAWTFARSSLGYLVYVGRCDADGVSVVNVKPAYSNSNRGVRFSRSAVRNLES